MLKRLSPLFFIAYLLPLPLNASFIEVTMGTAVVNDATAAYNNPASLTRLRKTQSIALYSLVESRTFFQGQSLISSTGLSERGQASTQGNASLPSLYLSIPISNKLNAGLALISNIFANDIDGSSILRYSQSGNSINSLDVVPALGFKVNDFLSLGAATNFSTAIFKLKPISGFPGLNIPDSQSLNKSRGQSSGFDLGFLLNPYKKLLIGFNHRVANRYHFHGSSTLNGPIRLRSNDYHFTFFTPGRSVLTLAYPLNKQVGLAFTITRIYWSIFKKIGIYNIATQGKSNPVIIPYAAVPYYLRDTWLLTLATQYNLTNKIIIRAAGSYNQAPGNTNYQITNGDSFILGSSLGYKINKQISLDMSYAHAFFNSAAIATQTTIQIHGVNKSSRDSVSLKLTYSL